MAHVLVTGGGFLGAAFAQRARTGGHRVTTADILPVADAPLDAGDPAAVSALVTILHPDAMDWTWIDDARLRRAPQYD